MFSILSTTHVNAQKVRLNIKYPVYTNYAQIAKFVFHYSTQLKGCL